MHRMLPTAAVALAGIALAAGCSSPPSTASTSAGDCNQGTICATTVAYSMLGPAVDSPSEGFFFFGAGDALGEEVFTYYVASIRAEQEEYYATGANSFPGTD